jgi:hypothetical protein
LNPGHPVPSTQNRYAWRYSYTPVFTFLPMTHLAVLQRSEPLLCWPSANLEQQRTFILNPPFWQFPHFWAIDGLSVDDMSLHDAQKDIVEFRSFIFISAED